MIKCSGYGIVDLIYDKNANLKAIEIGCHIGDTTIHFLKNLPNLKLTGIDPYIGYWDWDKNFYHQDKQYPIFLERTKEYSDRFNLLKNFSNEVVDQFKDNSIDFIFIDGMHTYEHVLMDCKNFYSKIKTGGVFAGHDYSLIKEVKQAVDEFASEVGIETIKKTDVDVWYWIKP